MYLLLLSFRFHLQVTDCRKLNENGTVLNFIIIEELTVDSKHHQHMSHLYHLVHLSEKNINKLSCHSNSRNGKISVAKKLQKCLTFTSHRDFYLLTQDNISFFDIFLDHVMQVMFIFILIPFLNVLRITKCRSLVVVVIIATIIRAWW